MAENLIEPRLRHPFTSIVAGPTMSGKTEFCRRLITSDAIAPSINDIIWCYSEWQPAYNALEGRVRFVDGLISGDELDPSTPHLVVIDDQMDKKDPRVELFFTRTCHHHNTSCIFIVQNLFNQNKGYRTCSLNAHYLFLFKNPRDALQIKTLARQMFPDKTNYLTESFHDATAAPYGYLCVDMKPDTPEHLRLRGDILNPHRQIVYIPRDYKYNYQPLNDSETNIRPNEEDGSST